MNCRLSGVICWYSPLLFVLANAYSKSSSLGSGSVRSPKRKYSQLSFTRIGGWQKFAVIRSINSFSGIRNLAANWSASRS